MMPAVGNQPRRSRQRSFKIMKTFSRQRRLLAFLVCLGFILPFAALAQTNAPAVTPAPLSPEAQDALKKGVMAAGQQDYLKAIQYFQDARKLAPGDPEIYYDLGLAESKIPGRELRAICWFEAYLSVRPNAPNQAAVREQIHTLDVNNRSNFSRLVKAFEDATNKLVKKNTEYDLNMALVAVFWEDAGDTTEALKTASLIRNADYKSQALRSIAYGRAGTGDIPGAQGVADLIKQPAEKDQALHSIADAQAVEGDITAALKTASLIQDSVDKEQALTSIVESQAASGDIDGAERTAKLNPGADDKTDALKCYAQAQAESGNFKAALGAADLISDPGSKSEALTSIAAGEKRGGLINDANETFALALRAADLAQNPDLKSWEQSTIRDGEKQGAKNPASDWLGMLDNSDPYSNSDCPLNTSAFLDVAGFLLKFIPPNDDPEIVLSEFQAAGGVLDKAQRAIHVKVEQQTKK